MTSAVDLDVVYHAIAHRTRREIIDLLHQRGLPATEIAAQFSISQPAVSQQLRVLLEADLVRAEAAGRRRIYRLNRERLRAVERWGSRAVTAPSGGDVGQSSAVRPDLNQYETEIQRRYRASERAWSMKIHKFKAKIQAGDGGGAYVLFPFDVEKAFGTKGKIPVKVAFNGVPFSGTLIKYGHPLHMLGMPKAIREQTQTAPGDLVRIELWKDEEPRTIQPPAELKEAMISAGVMEKFDCLSYTHRKEYCRWISEAKREETRLTRIAKATEMLKKGMPTPDARPRKKASR